MLVGAVEVVGGWRWLGGLGEGVVLDVMYIAA